MMFLAKVDVFGTPASLNIFGNPKKKSKFGGLCTLLFLGFVIWATYNAGRKLFVRDTPTTVESEVNKEDSRAISINSENWPMAFIVQAPLALGSAGFRNASIYSLEVQVDMLERIPQANGTVKRKWTYTKLRTEPCTKEYFGQYASSFNTFTFQGSYCIAKDQPELDSLELRGVYASALFKSLRVQVVQCNPSKTNITNVTCGTQAEINRYLAGATLTVMYMNNVMDLEKFEQPMSKFRDPYSTMISPAYYRESTIEIGYVEVTTDSGWLIESTKKQTSLQINRVLESFDPTPHTADGVLVAFLFQSGRMETYYKRTYIKIQGVLAEIGGIANAVLAVLLIVITPYLKTKSSEALMYELFDVKKDRRSNNKKNKAKKHIEAKNNNVNTLKKPDISIKALNSEQQLLNAMSPKSFMSEVMAFKITPNESEQHQGIELALPETYLTPRKHEPEKDASALAMSPTPNSPAKQNTSMSEDVEFPYENEKDPSPVRDLRESKKILSVAKSDSYQRIKTTIKSEEALATKKLGSDQKVSSHFSINVNVEGNGNPEVKENAKEIGKENQQEEQEGEKKEFAEKEEAKKVEVEWDLEKGVDEAKEEKEEQQDEVEVEEASATNNKNKNKTPLQVWEYALSLLYTPKALRPKIELIEEGVRIVEERLDINYILQRLAELEKLISLLLDQDQIYLFKSMPKPYLQAKLKRQSQISKKRTMRETLKEEIDEELALQAYQTIKNKANKSSIDAKLIDVCREKFA